MSSSRPKQAKKKATASRSQMTRRQRKEHAYRMRVPQVLWLVPLALIFGFGSVFGFFAGKEIRTSRLQADYMSQIGREIWFEMADGAAPKTRFPEFGPYNQRLGYSYLPFFIKSLESEGYEISAQMRASPQYKELVDHGLYPLYVPKTVAGLQLKDYEEHILYQASFPSHVFKDFESVPKLLVETLLFVEDRDLLKDGPETRNPAIEWDRFFYAALGQVLKAFAPGANLGGGSTLATQTEKFRFSPGGQTRGIKEKLRQIISASLRVYLNGPDTRKARERIVLDYLNSSPLSARAGFGEINSFGDGMWAWFGRDIQEITNALNLPEQEPADLKRKAMVYREVLGLILSQRRPTYYLLKDRLALDVLTDQTLANMAKVGLISEELREATRNVTFHFLPEAPPPNQISFLERKATNALRTHLMEILGLRNVYELDRFDIAASSTLDQEAQKDVTSFLKKMSDPAHVAANGFYGFRLLSQENDVAKINWSVLLYEKGEKGNRLRVQADNIDGPLDMNEGVKLDLGSTAKLRTLVTYLEIVGELYRRYAGLSAQDLNELTKEAPDVLTSWATVWLAANPKATLDEMLQASMTRKYSASPNETFFTGGGAHTFVNFEKREDGLIMDLHEALRDSVNLVFVRLMRDIVNYTIAQGQQTKQELLSDPDHPARQVYLERYADKEGQTFLNRYWSEYRKLDREAIIAKAASHVRRGATARAILFRSIDPDASLGEFKSFMKTYVDSEMGEDHLRKLYVDYPPDRYNLSDRAYITGANPLELWLVCYLLKHPETSRQKVLEDSAQVRQDSYAWLFSARQKGAQDTRIRILLELDAFARIQQRWARLGYPFDRLVPSFATSIGSSADRPEALAELMGILMNDGIRKPMLRFEKVHFAQGTPYETVMQPTSEKFERVLDPAIARIARAAMVEVVEAGTARRLSGSYVDKDGKPFLIGAKTGTGDHRYDEYGPGHRLISSRVVNRTGTTVFFIGDKFFGTVTAHVAGEEAGNFKFTSALSAQMLKSLAPVLQSLVAPDSKTETTKEEKAFPPPAEGAAQPVLIETPPPPDVVIDVPHEAERHPGGTSVLPSSSEQEVHPKPKPKPKHIDTEPKAAPMSSFDLMMDVLPQQ